MMTKLEKFRSDISRWGLMRALYNRVMRLAGRLLGVHVHVVRATAIGPDPIFPSIPPNISLHLIPPDQLLKVIDNPALSLSREFVQAALDRGDLVFGAFDGPELVSYVWRTFTVAPHADRLWVKVNKPYCYAYKSLTLPEYRGQRISPAVHIFSDVEMFRRGYTYRAGFVDVSNSASLAAGKHMGTRPIGYAGYAKWFGRVIPFRTSAVRKIGFEFFEQD